MRNENAIGKPWNFCSCEHSSSIQFDSVKTEKNSGEQFFLNHFYKQDSLLRLNHFTFSSTRSFHFYKKMDMFAEAALAKAGCKRILSKHIVFNHTKEKKTLVCRFPLKTRPNGWRLNFFFTFSLTMFQKKNG